MKRNEEITKLAHEIMLDITDSRLPLHNVLLKGSRLSLLVDIPKNVDLFKQWAQDAEQKGFLVTSFAVNMQASADPDISLASANPNEMVSIGTKTHGNAIERLQIRKDVSMVINTLANYRTQTYGFASNVYQQWQFGNVAETIFEQKRKRTEESLSKLLPDINQRLNSIEQNLRSEVPEDWKNAASSCRTLLMDIADQLNPPTTPADKNKYINRLKDVISPKQVGTVKAKTLNAMLEELKKRIEYTVDATQGPAHRDRPSKESAEDVVLYTYLAVAELMQANSAKARSGEGSGLELGSKDDQNDASTPAVPVKPNRKSPPKPKAA